MALTLMQQRQAYLRELERKKRIRYGLKPAQGTVTTSPAPAKPAAQRTATIQQMNRTERAKATGIKNEVRTVQGNKVVSEPKQPASLSSMLQSSGVNVLKSEPKRTQYNKDFKPSIEYLRDSKTGKMKQDVSLGDMLLLVRQVPKDGRPFTDKDVEDAILKPRSSPMYSPYYSLTYSGNDELAKQLLGKDTFDESDFFSPEALADYDLLEWNPSNQSPKAPTTRGARSTPEYQRAYKRWNMQGDFEEYKKAVAEQPNLNKQLAELALAFPEKSEREIIDMVDYTVTDDNGNPALRTIQDFRESAKKRTYKFTYGGDLFIDDEPMMAVVRAARNGEDVSQPKDYLYLDISKKQNNLQAAMQLDQKAPPPVRPQQAAQQPSMQRIGNSLNSLTGKALGSAAQYLRDNFTRPQDMPDILGFDAQKKQQAALDQSVTTTGYVDLRDPSIAEDQWPFLIESGLASQEQADAIIAGRKQSAQPEYTGMTPARAKTQSSSMPDSKMSKEELVAYRDTLQQQLDKLDAEERAEANKPAPYNRGNPETRRARNTARAKIMEEMAVADEALISLGAASAQSVAQQASQQQPVVAPVETAEQRTTRLMTTDIDALGANITDINVNARTAYDQYKQLDDEIKNLQSLALPTDHPAYQQTADAIAQASMERDALVKRYADQGIDITSSNGLTTAVIRQKKDLLDAAYVQYSSLPAVDPQFIQSASTGMALKNPNPDMGGVDFTGAALAKPGTNVGGFALGYDTNGQTNTGVYREGNLAPEGIQNPATYAKDNQLVISASVFLGNERRPEIVKLYNMGFMSDGEVQIYSGLLADPRYGADKADLYYQSVEPQLKMRQGEGIAGAMKGNVAAQIGFAALAGMGTAMQGIAQVGSAEPRKTNSGQYAGMMVRDSLKENGPKLPEALGGGSLGQAAYDVSFTIGNMVPAIAANAVVPGVGPAVIGASAGGNVYQQSIMEGHTVDEAAKYAVLNGVSEAFLETFLGTSVTGGKKLFSMIGKKAADAMQGAFKTALKGISTSMISNGTEEYLQDVIQPVFEKIAYDKEFQGLNLTDPQAVRSGVLGALVAVIGDSPKIAADIAGRPNVPPQAVIQQIEEATPEAEQAEPSMEEPDPTELTRDDIAKVETTARQAAYDFSMDEKNYTPLMQRIRAQLDAMGQQLATAAKEEQAARDKKIQLELKNAELLEAVANGDMEADAAQKQAKKNAVEIAKQKNVTDFYMNQRMQLAMQQKAAQESLSEAQGQQYQEAYQIELNKQLIEARQAKAQQLEQAEADRAAAEDSAIDEALYGQDMSSMEQNQANRAAQQQPDESFTPETQHPVDKLKSIPAEDNAVKDRVLSVLRTLYDYGVENDTLGDIPYVIDELGKGTMSWNDAHWMLSVLFDRADAIEAQSAKRMKQQQPVAVNPATENPIQVKADQPNTQLTGSVAQLQPGVAANQPRPVAMNSEPVRDVSVAATAPKPVQMNTEPQRAVSVAARGKVTTPNKEGMSQLQPGVAASTKPITVVANSGSTAQMQPGVGASTSPIQTNALTPAAASSMNYVPTNAPQKKIRRASQTANDLYKSMGVKYTGKNLPKQMRGSNGALGLFERHPGVVATKTHQNVNVYAHELGHAVFGRAKIFDAQGVAKPEFQKAVQTMMGNLPAQFVQNYPAQELGMEASAEFVRRYLLDRNAAENFAGADFVRYFEQNMLTGPQRKAMQKARTEFNNLLAAEKVDVYRARQSSGREKRDLSGAWENFISGIPDKYYPVLLYDIAANKAGYKNAGEKNASKRAYVAFSNIPYAATQAANIANKELSTPDKQVIGPSMSSIVSQVNFKDRTDFDTYITALHDVDRQAQSKPVYGDYTAADSAQVAQELASMHPEFVQVHQQLMAWWNAFLDEWVVRTNAIEDAANKVAVFRRLYPNYVPTYRSNNDSVDAMSESFGDMGGLLGKASVHFQKAVGSDKAIKSPIVSMTLRIGEIVTATNKVLAMRRIHDAYQAAPDGFENYIRLVEGTDGKNPDDLLKVIDERGAVHRYQVFDKPLYEALLVQPSRDDGIIWDMLGSMTGVFKRLTTMSNPFFAISNAMRDYVEAYTKGSNSNPITFTGQWLAAFGKLAKAEFTGREGRAVRNYYAAGGGDSSIAPRTNKGITEIERAMYSGYFKNALRRIVQGEGFMGKMQGGLDSMRTLGAAFEDVINKFNNAIEGSQRLAEFSRTYKRTGDAALAMYNSANVTTDFRRSGNSDVMRKAGKIFAFMNAAVQGAYSGYRMAMEARFDKAQFAARAAKTAVMFAAIPALIAAVIHSGDEEDKKAYALMAENVKEDNYLIPKSWVGGPAGEFIKIPKAKGPLSMLGDAMGRALIDSIQKAGNWDAFVQYELGDMAGEKGIALAESINPYGSPIFAPVIQIMMNRTWYGSPIESSWMVSENIAPENRVKDSTSSLAIFLAGLPGLKNKVSPVQADYFVNQTFGVVGDYITGDVGNAVLGGKQGNYQIGKTSADFIRTRLMTDPTAASDVTSSMYDLYDLLSGIVADDGQDAENQNKYARLNAGLTEPEQKKAVMEAKGLTKKGGLLYAAKQRTTKYYDQIELIQESDKTDQQKELEIRAVKLKMLQDNSVTVNAVEEYIRKYIKGTPALYKQIFGK